MAPSAAQFDSFNRGPLRRIRMRTWPATNDAVELYDLRADPGERTDRAAADPAGRDELLDDLLRWLAATRAPLPPRPGGG